MSEIKQFDLFREGIISEAKSRHISGNEAFRWLLEANPELQPSFDERINLLKTLVHRYYHD